jgi:hypothetical protein
MSSPLAESSGKPIIGAETPGMHFVGRAVIELYEGSGIMSDANGLMFIIIPGLGSGIDAEALIKRIAAALPARIPKWPQVLSGNARCSKKWLAQRRPSF